MSEERTEKNETSVVIPDGVTEIEADAFVRCSLTSVRIPDSGSARRNPRRRFFP